MAEHTHNNIVTQMEEALGYEQGSKDTNGWYPLGPLALICILLGVSANALM